MCLETSSRRPTPYAAEVVGDSRLSVRLVPPGLKYASVSERVRVRLVFLSVS